MWSTRYPAWLRGLIGACLLVTSFGAPPMAAQGEATAPATERSRIDLESGTFTNMEHGWSMSWSPAFWSWAADGDGRLLLSGETPAGELNFQAQTRDLRYADDWTSDCLALPANDPAFSGFSDVAVSRAGRPLAGQSGSRVWMLLEHPTVAGVISMDCRPLDDGATYLLITLYAESEDALVAAAPELMRMLASLRTPGTTPAT